MEIDGLLPHEEEEVPVWAFHLKVQKHLATNATCRTSLAATKLQLASLEVAVQTHLHPHLR